MNESAAYIATLATELAALARRAGLTDLAAILDMAALQARRDAGGGG